MQVDKKFKGQILYFKEAFGTPWKRILAVPAGTKDADKQIEEKEAEFRSSYTNAEFKTETK